MADLATTTDSTTPEPIITPAGTEVGASYQGLRERLRADLGRGEGDARADEIEELNQGLDDSGTPIYNRDPDRPHEQKIKKDEHGKIQEINSEALNVVLEKYLNSVLDTEREMQERKYGRGWLGRARRWIEESDIGKILKITAKLSMGVLAAAGIAGTAGLASPLLAAVGGRYALDGVMEAVQYFGFEGRHLQALRQSRCQRVQRVLEAMRLRNEIHRDSDETAKVADTRPSGRTIQQDLEDIISQLDQIERDIIEHEQGLARVRAWGGGIRFAAGMVVPGMMLHQFMTNGLALGMQNFDKLAIPGAAEHFVRMSSHGVNFAYSAAENLAGLVGSHTVGAIAPWSAIYASGLGAAGALAGMAGMEVSNIMKQRNLIANPKTGSIFTVRGRTALGATHAAHELSNVAVTPPGEVVTLDEEAKIREKIDRMTPGSIWRLPVVVGGASSGEETVIIDEISGGVLKYHLIKPDGSVGEGPYFYGRDGSRIKYRDGERLADSLDGYKSGEEVKKKETDPSIKAICESRLVPIPAENQEWMPETGSIVTLKSADTPPADVNIGADQRIKIVGLRDNRKIARIDIINADGAVAESKIVSVDRIVGQCKPFEKKDTKESDKEKHRKKLEAINKILYDKCGGELEKDQIWVVKNKWYAVAEIKPESGMLMLASGDLVSGEPASDVEIIKKKPRQVKFEAFEALLNEKDAAGDPVLVEYRDKVRRSSGGTPKRTT
jgi:hypothetical protein